ncbi:MAG: hypothetical protein IPN58_11470 [Anaerolineales bacterium]|nr:hypothetical protein [Anaerolineales bacterium]
MIARAIRQIRVQKELKRNSLSVKTCADSTRSQLGLNTDKAYCNNNRANLRKKYIGAILDLS